MKIFLSLLGVCVIIAMARSQCADEGFYECGDGDCVPGNWICDGEEDCLDGSDEGTNGTCPACPTGLFSCGSGQCVSVLFVCDGEDDCGDNSDEVSAQTGKCPTCPEGTYTCPSTGRCIQSTWHCDGDNDCGDWSDEEESACPCESDETRCTPPEDDAQNPGRCIPTDWFCDDEGIVDCPNGEDENNCNRTTISPSGRHAHGGVRSANVQSKTELYSKHHDKPASRHHH